MSHSLVRNTTLQEVYVRNTGCDANLLTNFVSEVGPHNTTLSFLEVTDNKIDEFDKVKARLEKEASFKLIREQEKDTKKKK